MAHGAWHCILWPCSLHPSASLRGGREVLATKPRWSGPGTLRYQSCIGAPVPGHSSEGILKGQLGQKGLLSSKSLNKTTAHHCKSGNSSAGWQQVPRTPTRTQSACSSLQKISYNLGGKNTVTVLFPCLKGSQTPQLSPSASDLSGLGPSGRFQQCPELQI